MASSLLTANTEDEYDVINRAFIFYPDYPYKSTLLLTDMQLHAIFDAFVYSLCAMACANTRELSFLIDFKKSFTLFHQHTRDFHPLFAPPVGLNLKQFKELHANS